jgi:hypothetical protein
MLWLVPRIRFAYRATRAKALVRAGAHLDLLPLRALTNQKLSDVANIDREDIGA